MILRVEDDKINEESEEEHTFSRDSQLNAQKSYYSSASPDDRNNYFAKLEQEETPGTGPTRNCQSPLIEDYHNQDANQIKSLSRHDSDSDNSEANLIDEDVVSSDSYRSVTEYLVSDQSSIIRAGSFAPVCKQSSP